MKFFFLLFVTLVIGSYMQHCAGISIGLQYAVVIDAGSTSSKAVTYKFYMIYPSRRLVINNGESYKKVQPGLSSFCKNPTEGGKQIQKLLELVKKNIPAENLSTTPLILRGTGGMRNLPSDQAETILEEVRKIFSRSGFYIGENAAEILSGVDEGIFSWFTINFLLNRLGSKKTVAALDMGGASAQVTFTVKDKLKSQLPILSDHMYTVSIPNDKIDVFSTCYSDLGAETLRYAVFKYGAPNEATNLNSVCVHPSVRSTPFNYHTKSFTINGKSNGKSTIDFDACMDVVKKVTLNSIRTKPHTENQHEIFAFSGFFYRLWNIGLIDIEKGGEFTLNDILLNTKKACSTVDAKNSFLCLDLTYIYVLLHDGYGLDLDTKIQFHQNINGHVISWTLGCAYDQLIDISRIKM
ncbi:ectonucleoside triphosphate diphosphohydrolase 5-like [Contarinia nasturtii]|uniref:ectonucleoside triphosphate diphosphohydrolase 5-like n=1 Tax=Contarinia nasturtii TaxID=265458 RepID=UPI0012D3B439|nr:ectonucleoside triphosphate diphosphohydrolase 5-like [Contarinia nasturtii]